ncbi:hypothetical protein Tco_0312230 [Tanacetum coccineum]
MLSIAPNPVLFQPNDYLADDDEEPEEEEEPIPEQAPAAPAGFASQWIGWHDLNNNNGWIKEDDEEEVEAEEEDEEEMEAEEDEDIEVEDNDDENDAEIIHPYEEADPLNRTPPSPETADGWEYRIRNQLPLKRQYRETPYDPSTNTTSRPQRDDPYVMVRDNAVRADVASDRGGELGFYTTCCKCWEEKDDKGEDAVCCQRLIALRVPWIST